MENFLANISKDFEIKEIKKFEPVEFLEQLKKLETEQKEELPKENKIKILNEYLTYIIQEKENIIKKRKAKHFIFIEEKQQNEFLSFLEKDFHFLKNQMSDGEISVQKIESIFFNILERSKTFQEYHNHLMEMKDL
jgi:hypothetical protein